MLTHSVLNDLTDIKSLAKDDFGQVDACLKTWLTSDIGLINEISTHIIQSGGKRLRPLLVLLIAKALAYEGHDHISLAAIIELIHTATLLHDDVIDSSTLRRGRKTANALFGNQASVLCGDFLYSRAFEHLIQLNQPEIIRILATTTNQIAQGEVLQLLNLGQAELSEAQYMRTIEAKTALLFQAACQCSGLLSLAESPLIHAAKTFGLNIGLAFQIMDDLLDYCGENQKLGKHTGDDFLEGKLTLPIIYLLTHGNENQKTQTRAALQQKDPAAFTDLVALIEYSGARDYTQTIALEKAQLAKQALECFPPSPYTEALNWLVEFSTQREQ